MAKKDMTLEEKLNEAIVKDGPYEVPGNWIWSKIKFIGDIKGGKRLPKGKQLLDFKTNYPYIRVADFDSGTIDIQELKYLDEESFSEIKNYTISSKDVYVSIAGTIGKVGIIPEILDGANLTENASKITDIKVISNKYLYYLLSSEKFQRDMQEASIATTQAKLALHKIADLTIPIPPLKEQQKIVNRIESLFEKLDKSKELIEEARDGFEKRKAAILEKSFRGELTEKWRNLHEELDEPLSDDYLELLRNENYNESCLVTGKKSKLKESCKIDIYGKTKGINRLNNLPSGWRWVSIGQITWSISDGPHFSPNYTSTGVPIISSRNVKYKKIDFSDAKYVSYEDYNEFIKRGKPEVGDILITKGGTTGITTMVDDDVEFCIWVHVALLKLVRKVAYPQYIRDALHSDLLYNQAQAQTHGVANRDLGLTRMIYMALPLPPIKEQKEIVRILGNLLEEESKVEELTQLEEQIELIKKSVLAKAFRGELGTNCEDDESALELLKEILSKN
jgi:type I restriction enzyme S subunit